MSTLFSTYLNYTNANGPERLAKKRESKAALKKKRVAQRGVMIPPVEFAFTPPVEPKLIRMSDITLPTKICSIPTGVASLVRVSAGKARLYVPISDGRAFDATHVIPQLGKMCNDGAPLKYALNNLDLSIDRDIHGVLTFLPHDEMYGDSDYDEDLDECDYWSDGETIANAVIFNWKRSKFRLIEFVPLDCSEPFAHKLWLNLPILPDGGNITLGDLELVKEEDFHAANIFCLGEAREVVEIADLPKNTRVQDEFDEFVSTIL